MSVVLVTGTDTGVGKTWVTCALARTLVNGGRRVVAIKPVETGCQGPAADGEDGVLLAKATGQPRPRVALMRLRAPLAPAVAAEAEGVATDFDTVVLEIALHAESADIVLMEGAGGLLAPVTWEWNIVDLALALDAKALVVASDSLGTINHTLLTLCAAEFAGLDILGVALIAPAEPDHSTGRNAAAIARLSGFERITTLPRQADPYAACTNLAEVGKWVTSSAQPRRDVDNLPAGHL